ncbi:unnamed protein product [Urochloa humidicola]
MAAPTAAAAGHGVGPAEYAEAPAPACRRPGRVVAAPGARRHRARPPPRHCASPAVASFLDAYRFGVAIVSRPPSSAAPVTGIGAATRVPSGRRYPAVRQLGDGARGPGAQVAVVRTRPDLLQTAATGRRPSCSLTSRRAQGAREAHGPAV